MKLAFTTEYDGSAFSGFQRQKNADSVQQNIEEALEKITQNTSTSQLQKILLIVQLMWKNLQRGIATWSP